MRTIAIMGGGDWADASVNHISVPDDMNLDSKQAEYRGWLRLNGPWKTFSDWLMENGGTNADVEEYWEI